MTVKGKKKAIRLNRLDLILLIILTAGVALLVNHISSSLNYRWNWAVIPQYFFRYDQSLQSWVPNLLVQGILTTIRISIWSSILALILGTVMSLMIRSKSLYLRLIGQTYVELVRNTPPLVLIFLFYFFFGNQIMTWLNVDGFLAGRSETTAKILTLLFAPKAHFSAFLSALLTMAIYEGAYFTEIIRAGLDAVPKGQWEAADSLGLSVRDKYQHVVLPQAFRTILPAMTGQFISTIKDSAIVSVISIQELTFQGMELMSATYLTFEIWITITLVYFCLTFSCSLAARWLEKKMMTHK